VALVALKRIPEAEVELKEATRRAPNDADAAYNLGAAYTAARKGDDAIRELKRALTLKPGLAEAHERIATSHFYEGRLAEARREFDEALKLQPDLADAHFGLGVLLTEEGKGEEAIREYEQVLATQPTHPGASTNLALLYGRTGHPLERATNRIAAFEMYRRALLRRDYAGAWKLLSPASRKSYIDDPDRFAFAAAKGWEEAKARERLAVPGFYLPFLEPPRVEPVSGLPFDPSRMGAERDKETGEWRVDVLIVHAIPGPDPLR
jgi:tetratricopeptide (TPR) repeat protein